MEDKEEDWVRPPGRKASIWDHFKESRRNGEQNPENLRVKCNHCNAIFHKNSRSTSNFLRHLRRIHYGLLQEIHYLQNNWETRSAWKCSTLWTYFCWKLVVWYCSCCPIHNLNFLFGCHQKIDLRVLSHFSLMCKLLLQRNTDFRVHIYFCSRPFSCSQTMAHTVHPNKYDTRPCVL